MMVAGVTLVVNAARGVMVKRHAKISMKTKVAVLAMILARTAMVAEVKVGVTALAMKTASA